MLPTTISNPFIYYRFHHVYEKDEQRMWTRLCDFRCAAIELVFTENLFRRLSRLLLQAIHIIQSIFEIVTICTETDCMER